MRLWGAFTDVTVTGVVTKPCQVAGHSHFRNSLKCNCIKTKAYRPLITQYVLTYVWFIGTGTCQDCRLSIFVCMGFTLQIIKVLYQAVYIFACVSRCVLFIYSVFILMYYFSVDCNFTSTALQAPGGLRFSPTCFFIKLLFQSFFFLCVRDFSGSPRLWSLTCSAVQQSRLYLPLECPASNFQVPFPDLAGIACCCRASRSHTEGWGGCGPCQAAVLEAAI